MASSKKPSTKVDASHALRLCDVLELPTSTAQVAETPPPTSPRPPKRELSLAHSPMTYTQVTALTPREGGCVMAVSLTTYLCPTDQEERQQETYEISILMSSSQELALTIGEISSEKLRLLTKAQKLYDAVRQSITYLGYGSMSRRRLAQKLALKGFDKETTQSAVAYMAQRGYLEEFDTAMRFAERGVHKAWGPRRIQSDLYARGFSAETVEQVMESLEDVDFVASCRALIQRKLGGAPQDPDARRKLIAALMRYGHTTEVINQALKK